MKALTVAEAIGDGVTSVPETLLDGLKRTAEGLEFWDTEQEVKIGGQNERAFAALKELAKYGIANFNSPVEKAIRIILFHFYENLPKAEKQKVIDAISRKGIYTTSKLATSAILSQIIAFRVTKAIMRGAAIKMLFRVLSSAELTLLSVQGLLYKAGAASDRLRKKYPIIFMQMRNQNVDMLYFLIEKPMAKYMDAIRLLKMKLPVNLIDMV
jgi:hypothetical protein